MYQVKLNIGLNVTGEAIALSNEGVVAAAIKVFAPHHMRIHVKMSSTEPTAVVQIKTAAAPTKENITILCRMLRQEAIAGRVDGEGFLFGPKAEAWGPFNAEFFIE